MKAKVLCILRLSIVCGENSSIPAIKLRMGNQVDVVLKYTAIQRIAWTRWWTSTVRDPRNPKKGWENWIVNQKISLKELYLCWCSTSAFGGKKKRTNSLVWEKFSNGTWIRKAFRLRMLVISRSLVQKKKWNAADTVGGHPIFRATNALDQGQLKEQRWWKGSLFISVRFAADHRDKFSLDCSCKASRRFPATNLKYMLVVAKLILLRIKQSRWWHPQTCSTFTSL